MFISHIFDSCILDLYNTDILVGTFSLVNIYLTKLVTTLQRLYPIIKFTLLLQSSKESTYCESSGKLEFVTAYVLFFQITFLNPDLHHPCAFSAVQVNPNFFFIVKIHNAQTYMYVILLKFANLPIYTSIHESTIF